MSESNESIQTNLIDKSEEVTMNDRKINYSKVLHEKTFSRSISKYLGLL